MSDDPKLIVSENIANSGDVFTWNCPKAKSILHVAPHSNGPDAFTIESPCPMPSRWVRFWYWALLGWTWERVQ